MFGQEPFVDVQPLYSLLNNCAVNYKVFCLLSAAVETGLFDHLEAPRPTVELSRELGLNPRIARIVCKCLEKLGFLVEVNGAYQNAEISNLYLRTGSPLAQENVLKTLRGTFRLWEKLPEVLKGGPVKIREEEFFGEDHIHAIAAEHLTGELPKTVRIVAGLPEFQKARKLLDLGSGHGLYAIAFSKLNPGLRVFVYDLPGVTQKTRAYIEKHGAKVTVMAGNFFQDDLGSGYDLVFFAYNPGGKNPGLVPKIHASLNEGGLFVSKHCFYRKGEETKDIFLDLEWNLTTFAGVKKGDRVYSFEGDLSFEDYLELLSGYFSIEKVIETAAFAGPSLGKIGDALDSKIIIAKKRLSR
ncbi:MAG: methyltransferase [Armatimonadetes bacterium]|nr:methyltransferase [Armatimonadota bacterium]